jgi:hypothetical protein
MREVFAWQCPDCPVAVPDLERLDRHTLDRHPLSAFATTAKLRRAERDLSMARAELASACAELRMLRASFRDESGS